MIWLIFYNGWQDGVYDKLVNFATAGYSFINNIFVKSIRNPKNQMVIFSENAEESIILRVVEVNNINTSVEAEPVMLCIKYDILDNVSYSRRDINTQRCERGFYSNYRINSTYEEGSEIFVRKATKEERRTSKNVIISNNQELSRLIYYIDTYNSDISKVKKITQDGFSKRIVFDCNTDLIIKKGSIAINGVSLTVSDVKENEFEVSLIPQTLNDTNLKNLKIGDIVNIEYDLFAKYIQKFCSKKQNNITLEFLRENGF